MLKIFLTSVKIKIQETLSTQHTKIYAADDKLILSGANLEKAYFLNRQDRYIEFANQSLTDFFCGLAEAIGRHSWEDVDGKLKEPNTSSLLEEDFAESFKTLDTEHTSDTVFYPNVQAGWSNVNIEVC